MSPKTRYWTAIALIVLTLILLYPGLTKNALTIRGVLDAEGAGATAQRELINHLTQAPLPPEDLKRVRPFLNQSTMATMDDQTLNTFLSRLVGSMVSGKIAGARQESGVQATTVYVQTQTIVVTIRYLYENGGYLAATLLLLFSVCVPIGKVLVFLIAIHTRASVRERLLGFINFIGKWSMADVFVVAIYTAYLGAKSSVGVGQPVHFETEYGPGFYWFAAYCIVSLAAQQAAVALMRDWRRAEPSPAG